MLLTIIDTLDWFNCNIPFIKLCAQPTLSRPPHPTLSENPIFKLLMTFLNNAFTSPQSLFYLDTMDMRLNASIVRRSLVRSCIPTNYYQCTSSMYGLWDNKCRSLLVRTVPLKSIELSRPRLKCRVGARLVQRCY